MGAVLMFWLIAALLCSLKIDFAIAAEHVTREHPCNFEPSVGFCGWQQPDLGDSVGESGLVEAASAPHGGPPVDANPGMGDGRYFYFFSQGLSQSVAILQFPSVRYICGLSFAYYSLGPLDLDVLRKNVESSNIMLSTTSMWEQSTSFSYNVTAIPTDAGQLVFQVFDFDPGEAPLEGIDSDLFLALDDANITFCLPCDFDNLSASGNLLLNNPSEFGITFGGVNQFTLQGSSPICPTVPLVFAIDSVDPNHLSSIFSINEQGETATVLVNGTGPGLDANGTSGTVTVSVHVKGSNYRYTSEPFKQTALVSFQHPPTIIVQSPSEISVEVTSSLSYQLEASSALTLSTPLRFENFRTTPQELQNDFTLDVSTAEVTGMILLSSLAEIIDTAVTPSFSVDVTNEYGGFIVHTVTIHFNPSAPLFNQTHYTFSILEEQSSDDLVGTVAVIDPNNRENDGINFPFFTDPAVMDKFLILPNGPSEAYYLFDILSIHSFDYEERTLYALEIGITDRDDASLSSTATVTVNIISVNEFSPFFNIPRLDRIISDVSPIEDFVAEFRATDADQGADGEIQYSISSGNEDNFFGLVSPSNGTVVVKRSPILPRMYTLVITASDGGAPPRSANAMLVINVTASNQVDCSEPQYGPPVISHFGGLPDEPVDADITFNCNYGIPDPVVVIYKWVFYNSDPAESVTITMNEHYTIETYSLTIHNISVADAGFYRCHVENQCGSDRIHYQLRIIDYPEPPENVRVTDGPSAQNVSLAWDTPDQPQTNFILKPILGFVVQTKRAAESEDMYETSAEVGPEVNSVSLDNLSPGTVYNIRVLSVNQAGATPSGSLVINTTATAPKLRTFLATALSNNSLLLEWELEFDGGYPVTNFQIAIEAQSLRQRRQAPNHLSILLSPDQAEAGSFVTQALPSGVAYMITASVENVIGRMERETNAFIGHTDSSICSFEELVDISNGGCPWQLEGGIATVAENAEPPLPTVDAGSNPQGRYVYFKPDSSPSEFVIMSHSAAGYVCGYSFYYQLLGDAELLLQTSSEDIVWFSGRHNYENTPWISVSTEQRVFLSSSADEELLFVLVSYGHSSDLIAPQVALDLVELEFCLPCDFELMATEENLRLSYVNYTKIFLRTVHTIPVTVNVEGCENALLDFTISRVVPNDLETSFSIIQQGGQDVTIMVDPISADLAGSHTIGFVEVIVSVLESDYKQPGSPVISQPALIDFTLVETTSNCTFTEHCDFDQGSCSWSLGRGVQITQSENPPLTYLSSTGSYVYGDSTRFQSAAISTDIISTNVKDDFCAVSFSYSASMVELQINVDGLRSVWSSIVVDGDTASRGWVYETASIDLQSVAIQENRELSFDVYMFDVFGEADLDGEVIYFALDNITLHPCIDCSTTTQECRFSSCLPGYYFSLSAESCVACPAGYYCPDWRELPTPCPPGTHSTTSSAANRDTCQTCPGNTYTLRPGSSSCVPCPQGYSCTNPAAVPAVENCSSKKISLAAAVAVSVGGTLAFAALCGIFCCIGCYCFISKRKKAKEERRRKERARFLLSDEGSLTSTTVGRSSMASSAFDLEGRRWNRGRDASTLMSFMTDDTTNGQSHAYGDDASWTDAMELTSSQGRLDSFEQTLQNPLYTDDEDDNMIELEDKTAGKTTYKKPAVPASQF